MLRCDGNEIGSFGILDQLILSNRSDSVGEDEHRQQCLAVYHHREVNSRILDLSNVFVVWSCKTLQNYKCLASTDISGDGIYAEYTYNGDKQELYEDVYGKITNTCHTEE